MDKSKYNAEYIKERFGIFFQTAADAKDTEEARTKLRELVHRWEYESLSDPSLSRDETVRIRDSAVALSSILKKRSEELSGFSFAEAIREVGLGKSRPDLSQAFWAEVYHLLEPFYLVREEGCRHTPSEKDQLQGRPAAIKRSRELDELWKDRIATGLSRYETGLSPDAVERRERRKRKILEKLKGTDKDWEDYRWQYRNLARELKDLEGLVELTREEREGIREARRHRLPFGVTPYYLSLMDEDPNPRDRSIRKQVFPPLSYVEKMVKAKADGECSLDFMLEGDTSPIDLITRRYPSIAIFKPFNACPQICVYCQRNWEIEEPMGKHALAPPEKIDAAIEWIEEHPALHEILVTGGDPLALGTSRLKDILSRLAAIPSISFLRIGTRTLVTSPMRIDEELADLLASFREPGRRQVAVVTHVQHPYEITPELAAAVERLRIRGIPVYNQLVYTFYVSRRFEAAALRHTLRLAGIDPYYTFCTKGKEETADYFTPIARLLQEQKEEARLLPGLTRTDEAVFNVPGLGKVHLRASQHRELLSILPDGSRVYEFHPWEKNIKEDFKTYVGKDTPILNYLERLEAIGEDPEDYATIWHYI